jgi:predicted nucleic acid-binding protein
VKKSDAFCDTGALVPLFTNQPGSAHVRSALNRASLTVWWGTAVELRSAFSRLAREGRIHATQIARANARLLALRERWIEILPSERVREIAIALAERHPLRAADAFQLAAALVWANERPRSRAFLCFDGRLAEAARKEGFAVETQ